MFVPIVEGKRGCFMLVMSPHAHNNILLGSQACDTHEASKKMNIEMEELFAPGVIEKTKHLKDTEQIPHSSHAQFPSS